jgi:hypothetical protein
MAPILSCRALIADDCGEVISPMAPRSTRTVSTIEEITCVLAHGRTPITSNDTALRALGFQRLYAQATQGYDSTIWSRQVDAGFRATDRGLQRVLAVERAILEP